MGNIEVEYEAGRGGSADEALPFFTAVFKDHEKAAGWYNQYKEDHGDVLQEVFGENIEGIFSDPAQAELWVSEQEGNKTALVEKYDKIKELIEENKG